VGQKIRIIAGALGGRLLEVPEEGTRPFADRVRQALFAILEPRLPDARVLDLCAGSGAAGLEALSRGAQHVQFVGALRSGMLELIADHPSPLATGGLLVLSGRRVKGETTQVAPRGLRLVRGLTYGETAIDLYEHEGAEELR